MRRQNPSKGINVRTHRRRGGLLVCVLVVLLLVGLLAAQTMQTLMMVRKSDSRSSTLRQATELVELGRMSQRQATELPPTRDISVSVDHTTEGLIRIQAWPVEQDRNTESRYRVVARFPTGTDREVTASWEGNE